MGLRPVHIHLWPFAEFSALAIGPTSNCVAKSCTGNYSYWVAMAQPHVGLSITRNNGRSVTHEGSKAREFDFKKRNRVMLSIQAISQIPGAAFEIFIKSSKAVSELFRYRRGAADLSPAGVVVPRSKPAAGILPASRLASSQNLWRRHPLLFMRRLVTRSETSHTKPHTLLAEPGRGEGVTW